MEDQFQGDECPLDGLTTHSGVGQLAAGALEDDHPLLGAPGQKGGLLKQASVDDGHYKVRRCLSFHEQPGPDLIIPDLEPSDLRPDKRECLESSQDWLAPLTIVRSRAEFPK